MAKKSLTDFDFSKLGSHEIADISENFIGGIFDIIRDRCYEEICQALDESRPHILDFLDEKGNVNFSLGHPDYNFTFTRKGIDHVATVNVCPYDAIEGVVSAVINSTLELADGNKIDKKLGKMIKYLEGQIERLKSPA